MQRYSRILLITSSLLTGFFNSACSILPATSGLPPSSAYTQRNYQDHIQLSGKLAIHYEKNNQTQNLPANFIWEQNGKDLKVTILSPLGQTLARITDNAQGAMLEQDGKMPVQASDLDQLLATTLRWPLPVSGMRDWLQGSLLQPDGSHRMLNAADQTVEAAGWKIRYASWHTTPVMPKRIDLSRYTTETGEVSLNIFVEAPETP
jgi:outer membrane lipoprotein LolB